MNDKLLTLKEVCEYLKLHPQTIRANIASNKLRATKFGKSFRIKESDMLSFGRYRQERKRPFREVELRFITDNLKEVERRLFYFDAKVVYQGHVIDHWYVPTHIKNLKEKNDWFESGNGFGLRIREQDNGYTGKIETSLEVKRLEEPYNHSVCLESEVTAGDYNSLSSLLSLMNFKEMTTLEKDRLVYKLTYMSEEFKVVIDDIKGFKTGIEIECFTNKYAQPIASKIRKLAFRLGISLTKDITDKSITYLYMEQNSKF